MFQSLDIEPMISTGAVVKNLASNVNLSYYMDLWTLESKLQKNNCWTFFQLPLRSFQGPSSYNH